MAGAEKVFVDTSVLFSAAWSEEGGSQMLLKLGEAGLIRPLVSAQVLQEAEGVINRKAPDLLPLLGLLIDRSGIAVTASGSPSEVMRWTRIVGHPGDAQIVADAARAKVDALVTLDKKHLHGNRALKKAAPFPVFTPAEFLARFRDVYE